jgi:hypothetical protein
MIWASLPAAAAAPAGIGTRTVPARWLTSVAPPFVTFENQPEIETVCSGVLAVTP